MFHDIHNAVHKFLFHRGALLLLLLLLLRPVCECTIDTECHENMYQHYRMYSLYSVLELKRSKILCVSGVI